MPGTCYLIPRVFMPAARAVQARMLCHLGMSYRSIYNAASEPIPPSGLTSTHISSPLVGEDTGGGGTLPQYSPLRPSPIKGAGKFDRKIEQSSMLIPEASAEMWVEP